MLKLIYDIKCGFKELYMTAKNQEFDISYLADKEAICGPVDMYVPTEDELFAELQIADQAELENYFYENGILGIIQETTELDYAHTYFKEICFGNPNHKVVPGYTRIYNLRVVKKTTISIDCENKSKDDFKNELYRVKAQMENGLKAKDVMAILKVTRQTLCNYVKRGYIKVSTNYDGGQYTYDYDSVMAMKNKKSKVDIVLK